MWMFPPHLLWLNEFELHASAGPGNKVWVGWVVQQSHQELPELQRAPALVRWALTVQARLLLDVTCSTNNRLLLRAFPVRALRIGLLHTRGGTHLQLSQAPRRCHRRSASPLCQTCTLENMTSTECLDMTFSKNLKCSTFTRVFGGTFSPVRVSQIAVLP